jgi:hypothetical protein
MKDFLYDIMDMIPEILAFVVACIVVAICLLSLGTILALVVICFLKYIAIPIVALVI